MLRECPKALLRGRAAHWMEIFGLVRCGLLAVREDWPAKDVEAVGALMQEAERRRRSEQQR